ncbi:MAG TPA: porin [Arthrobacter sp.]|nr:porin [Arthrobacter sp.]
MIGGLWKSTSSLAMLAAVGLFVGGVPSARAADLGGDCCADLEERVAELEATVARKGNRRVSLTISGQVSTAVMAWDAGAGIAATAGSPESFKTTTTTTTTTVVGPANFAAADTNIAPDALPVQCAPGGVPNLFIGCGAAGHIDPPHVHGAHTHAATSTSTSTSTTTKTAAVAAKGLGKRRDIYVVDNVMSGGTFFALSGSARVNPNVTAGFNITIAMDVGGRSHQVSQFDDDGTDSAAAALPNRAAGGFDTDIVMTLANWYIDHKSFGRVTLGRINTATAGITTIDLGGAGVIANASFGYTQRGFTDPGSGLTWSAILGGNSVNGASLSRANAVSYTSPTVGGFSVAAAWGENDIWDVGVRYAGEFSGFRIAAGLGYIVNQSGLGDFSEESGLTAGGAQPTQLKGSASILHVATGLYVTGAYLNQDNDTAGVRDTTLWYLQGGISKNWTGLGNTVVYGEYGRVDDPVLTGHCAGNTHCDVRAELWGLGIVQHIDAAAMEMFLSYKQFSASTEDNALHGVHFHDFNVVMGGARIRF